MHRGAVLPAVVTAMRCATCGVWVHLSRGALSGTYRGVEHCEKEVPRTTFRSVSNDRCVAPLPTDSISAATRGRGLGV